MNQTMELKEFITKALIDITTGVEEARKDNETTRKIIANDKAPSGVSDWKAKTDRINFDVLVTLNNTFEAKGGGALKMGIAVISANIGSGESQQDNKHVANRVSFSIPVNFFELK